MNPRAHRRRVADSEHDRQLAALDRVLMNDEELIPSSGFASAVMKRAREEAAAPAPLAFPWKRVLPAGALAAALLGWGVVEWGRAMYALGSSFAGSARTAGSAAEVLLPVLWIALAVAAPFLIQRIARRIAGDSGLF